MTTTSPTAAVPVIDSRAPWVRRFAAARTSLPDHAELAPGRCVLVSNASGVFEIYAWNRTTGELRQATNRPNGTFMATVEPSGEHIVWFADTDGDEFGVWNRQPFVGGHDEPLVPELAPSYPAGLGFADDGTITVGRATDDGVTIHVVRPGAAPVEVYAHAEDAHVGALSRDGQLLAIAHSEHGDSRHLALRVFSLDVNGMPTVVADMWDGKGKGLEAIDFAPAPGEPRLLVGHERRGRTELAVWNPRTGELDELPVDLPGELDGSWYPNGQAILINHDYNARAELYRFDLASGDLKPLGTPPGVVGQATVRPDGDVEYSWSSSEEPRAVRNLAGDIVLSPPGEPAPGSVPVTDAWVDGPGGPIHALVSTPPGDGRRVGTAAVTAPYPTVFSVHGGPHALDADSFDPDAASWVDHGFAVVRINYRGSTGYGSAWRDALEGRVGLTELEDVAAVRDWAVETGLADPDRLVLTGGSWGGYLTLLGLGAQPDRWSLGIAIVPVADYIAAYEDEMEPLRAFDRAMFGGSPEEQPERWMESNPMTYVDQVRVPVLVLAGENDPRCPIRQIDNYLARLRELSTPHEVYRYEAGHGSLVVDERVRHQAICLDFATRQLPALPTLP